MDRFRAPRWVYPIHPLQQLDPALDLFRPILSNAVFLDKALYLCDPFLLPSISSPLDFLPLCLFGPVEVIVSGIGDELRGIDFNDSANHSVQKGPVVGDDQKGRGNPLEVIL